MKLGIFAKTFDGDTPSVVLRAARDAGFAAVQYNMACSGLGALPTQIPDAAVHDLLAAASASEIEIAAISATYNMTHPDSTKREAGRASFEAIAAIARRVGSRVVTICTGSLDAQDQWRRHPGNDSSEAWREMVAEFALLVSIAEKHGVLIGVEPELANVVSTPARARKLLSLFPSGPLRIVLDPANLFERGEGADVQPAIREAIERLGRDVVMAHAKDRRADGDVAAPGKGVVDFPEFLSGLQREGFDGAVVTHGIAAQEAPECARYLKQAMPMSRVR